MLPVISGDGDFAELALRAETGASIVAANCPFCITMLQDGIKEKERQESVMVLDLSEMIVQSKGL